MLIEFWYDMYDLLNLIEKVLIVKLLSDLTGWIVQLVTKLVHKKGSQYIKIHDIIQNYSINMTYEGGLKSS